MRPLGPRKAQAPPAFARRDPIDITMLQPICLDEMRTTIRLDDQLLARAKAHALRTGRSLTGLIEDALRSLLDRSDAPRREGRFEMITCSGEGLRPGVDLDDTSGLEDLMDARVPDRR